MSFNKQTLITGFALFAMFFGAGNLILPPYLGFLNSSNWLIVCLAFCLSAVVLPLVGVLAHAHLQGTIVSFGTPISKKLSIAFSFVIYLIAIGFPAPRTAAVTHEIAILPYFDSPEYVTSIIFFGLVFLFAIGRTKLLDNIAVWLTPALVLSLLCIIGSVFLNSDVATATVEKGSWKGDMTFFGLGFIEGFQTFDAIGAMVVGAVVIRSLKIKKETDYNALKFTISTAAFIAGSLLFMIYASLMWVGASRAGYVDPEISRPGLLSDISNYGLGTYGTMILAALVAVACFSTAVGIITGTADFVSEYVKKKHTYTTVVAICCVIGVFMGQLSVEDIIHVAYPVVVFIYPIVIALILLNFLAPYGGHQIEGTRYKSVYRWTIGAVIFFSLPAFLVKFKILSNWYTDLFSILPFNQYEIGWVLPSLITAIVTRVIGDIKKNRRKIKNATDS